VRLVQRRLIDRGFKPGYADGVFGRRTAAAVKEFQRSQGFLKATGVVDVHTFSALFTQ
jgi:peptidoglycan hydrolase-like protein with peptidoglycan-binding domain